MNEKLSFIIEFKNMASKGLKDVKKNVEDVKKSTDGLKKETKGLRGVFDKMSGGAKKAFGKVKDSASNSFNAIKKGAGALGPMIAGAFAAVGVASFGKDVLQVGMEFDSMMSEVQALSGATGDDLDKLRQKAKDLGSSTKFSASESAEAFKFMSLAGWNAEEMLDAVDGVMMAAAASGESLASVSDIITDGLSAFSLEAKDATMFADVLAKTASSTNTDIAGLGEAFKYSAASANAVGMEVQETAGFLGLLANNSIKGSSGGTVLNAVLRDMKKNATDGALAIGDASVAVYDAEGNMRGFSDILADVESATVGMTQAQKDAALSANFGDEAMRGINIAMAEGVDTLKDLEGELYNSAGAAQEMADVMADNLGGDMDSLSSAWEGFKIALFDGGLGNAFRPLVQGLTKSIQWVTKLSDRFSKFDKSNTAIGKAVKKVWGDLTKWVGDKVEQLKPTFESLASVGQAMVSVLIGVFQTLWAIVSPVLTMLGTGLRILADIAIWAFQNIIVPSVQLVWGAIQTLWGIAQPILSLLAAAFEAVSEVVIWLWENALVPLVGVIQGALVSAINAAMPVINGIASAFETLSSWVQSGVEWITSLIDKVKNFSVPNWLSKLGGGGTIKFEGADGSHATGAFNIPFDGYMAELHRGESVLTADQSNALRSMGALERGSGGTTRLNLDAMQPRYSASSGATSNVSMGGVSINITAGGNASAKDIAREVQRVLEREINKASAVLGYS